MTAQSSDLSQLRRPSLANGQAAASKALGVPIVHVEAVDQDGNKVVEKVESEIALLWPFVHKEVVNGKHGKTLDDPVQLPKQVGQDILALLLEYCRYHRFPGRSDKERKIFDEKFIRLDTRRLCELTSAADSLDMRPLVDLSSRALARMIEGKSPDEIRETFHLPDDLTEEEKLEPVKNVADDPRIRLLNRLYAKKRKELAEKKAELQRREAGVKCITHPSEETRSVEELLSFIEEERQGQGKKTGKRKKPKKRKDTSADHSLASARSSESKQSDKGAPLLSPASPNSHDSLNRGESLSQEGLGWPEGEDVDDAELDDEIEAFERSLKADWEERRAELIFMAGAISKREPLSQGLQAKQAASSSEAQPKNGRKEPSARGQTPQKSQHAPLSDQASPLQATSEGSLETDSAAQATSASMPHINGHASPIRPSSSSPSNDSRQAPRPGSQLHPCQGTTEGPKSSPESSGQKQYPKLDDNGTAVDDVEHASDPSSPKLATIHAPLSQEAQDIGRGASQSQQDLVQQRHEQESVSEEEQLYAGPSLLQSAVRATRQADSGNRSNTGPEGVLRMVPSDSSHVATGDFISTAVSESPITEQSSTPQARRAEPAREAGRLPENTEDLEASHSSVQAETSPSRQNTVLAAEAVIEALQDFLQQVGLGDAVFVEQNLHSHWSVLDKDSRDNEVLVERIVPTLGLLKLQCMHVSPDG